jgi:hypothetical protein
MSIKAIVKSNNYKSEKVGVLINNGEIQKFGIKFCDYHRAKYINGVVDTNDEALQKSEKPDFIRIPIMAPFINNGKMDIFLKWVFYS